MRIPEGWTLEAGHAAPWTVYVAWGLGLLSFAVLAWAALCPLWRGRR